VTHAPVDANSQSYIDWISGRSADNPDARQRLHPDMAPPPWGIPYMGVDGDTPLSPVTFTSYARESDAGAPGMPAGYPIPAEARSQSNYIENAAAGGNTSGDRHMLIIDRDHWLLYELYQAQWNGSNWEAASGAVFDLKSNYRRPEGWTSTDAAGLAVFPGLVRHDEVEAPVRSRTRSALPRARPTDTCGPHPTKPVTLPARRRSARDFASKPPRTSAAIRPR